MASYRVRDVYAVRDDGLYQESFLVSESGDSYLIGAYRVRDAYTMLF